MRQFFRVATHPQAFDKTVQGPDIARMLGAAQERVAQAQVFPVGPLGLVMAALLGKEGGKGVARRMHPGPGLGIFKIVVAADALAQMRERLVMVPLVIGEIAIEHLLADRQNRVG